MNITLFYSVFISFYFIHLARAHYILVGGHNRDLSIKCDTGTGKCVGCSKEDEQASIFKDGEIKGGRQQIRLSQAPNYCLYRRDMSLAVGPCLSNPPDYHLFLFEKAHIFGYAGPQKWPLWWVDFDQELTFVAGRQYWPHAWQLVWNKEDRFIEKGH